jgi:hypothetical protein
MASRFWWFDPSEQQRGRILDAGSLFHEQGTVSELAFGAAGRDKG